MNKIDAYEAISVELIGVDGLGQLIGPLHMEEINRVLKIENISRPVIFCEDVSW